jgi:hypothetical protein
METIEYINRKHPLDRHSNRHRAVVLVSNVERFRLGEFFPLELTEWTKICLQGNNRVLAELN